MDPSIAHPNIINYLIVTQSPRMAGNKQIRAHSHTAIVLVTAHFLQPLCMHLGMLADYPSHTFT